MSEENIEKDKLSPMMVQYRRLKEKYPDTIVLYRLGDFYEMFFDDAVKASKILDLTLTGRGCGLEERAPMCGVPYHAVDTYISRLLAAGEKVAICEQLTNPGEQKGMLKRDVIRVITPGTNTIEEMLDGAVNHYLVAVTRDKSGTEYAVAMLDIITGEFKAKCLRDANFTDVEDFLLGITPSEIISTADICAESKRLNSVICERLVKFTPFYDYSFDYDNAKDRLLKQFGAFGPEALGLGDNNKTVACALGGLLEYVVNTQKRSLSHISTPRLIADDAEMYIDYNTRKNLELTETLADGKRSGSLLWVIDRTKTGMGARKLRSWLLHPLQKIADIEKRQNAVAELYKNNSLRNGLGLTLSKIKDLERLVTKISYGTVNPKDCLALCSSLEVLPVLKSALGKLKSEYFTELKAKYVDLDETAGKLKTTINPDAPSLTKDGGYIADGVNKELDELRDLRKNSSKVLDEFTERQRKITGVPSLRVGFNRIFGYYIEITKAKKPETLPSDYIRKQTVVNGERYINDELLRLEKEIMSASERSLVLEDEIFTELKKYLFDRIKYFKTDADIIADTDCICSLADVAETNNYVKPKMTEKGAIEITEGRHPVVEALLKANEFVPNDTVIDNDNPVSILTGPNMAGKSTYIRQVAVIVLLAHIGSFVPASKAEICVVDRIFTRVGASDNLVRGQSTFMVEMLEVANILNNATPKSLLILDEIGRGTSTLDGLSIAWAIVEHIFLKIKAKTLFATHYHELGELEGTFPGIKNYRVLVQENPSGIVFLYKIARGSASRSFGIEAAAIAGVKSSVIKRAKDILKNLSETHELSGDLKEKMSSRVTESSVACEQMTLFPEDEKFTKIKNMLNGTDLNRCTPLEALTILADMKKILE
jgi:DNA mismatch repair protein MutS